MLTPTQPPPKYSDLPSAIEKCPSCDWRSYYSCPEHGQAPQQSEARQTPEEKAEAYDEWTYARDVINGPLYPKDHWLAGHAEGHRAALSSPEVMGLIEALKDAAASERRCSEGCHSVYEKPGKNRFELVIQRFQSLSGREYSNVGKE